MSCELCLQNSRSCQPFHHQSNYGSHFYSDVPFSPPGMEEEPVAPTLSLGNRILWLTELQAASGIVRWIGRIPSISTEWTAGIEFDNVMPEGGNGDFLGRIFFNSRPGHALFLPVREVLKVDDSSSSNSDRSSFLERLQDTCSNFAHRRRRDSTFGHFKQECHSSCSHNDAHYNHVYSHAPVYDRITSRRSLHYEDHPYEPFSSCMPHNPPQLSQNQNLMVQNGIIHSYPPGPRPREECIMVSNNRSNESDSADYATHDFSKFTLTRKDTLPRPSLRFITDLKEWVSCFIMGTNRRKSKRKLVVKDRRSVTSVFLTNNSQSLTGQRLSSFKDYASINMSRIPSNSEKSRVLKDTRTPDNTKQGTYSKRKSRKKRPAPLPPIPYKTSNDDVPVGTMNGVTDIVIRKRDSQSESRGKVVAKTTKSTSVVTHSAPLKKSHKKGKAPPPPVVLTKTSSAIYASVQKKEPRNSHSGFGHNSKLGDYKLPSVKQTYREDGTVSQNLNSISSHQSRRNWSHRQKRRSKPLYSGRKSTNGYLESEDSSSSGSISFSPGESEDEKDGLVKYKIAKGIEGIETGLPMSRSTNFVQYAGEDNDVCLKISIQKTETNVVTVEEVPSSHTARYTIEEDTSSSDLSDNPYISEVPHIEEKTMKALPEPITYTPKVTERKNSSDSSSISPEDTADDPKTIFKELQIQPPAKGSVKDFVNAFNMLAVKSNGVGQWAPSQSNPGPSDPSAAYGAKSKSKNILSFPTKWEFQNNGNQFLHPIAEESHNDTSEYDGKEDEDRTFRHSTPGKHKGKKFTVPQGYAIKQNTSELKECSKSCERRNALRIENTVHNKNIKPGEISSHASDAALLSLLQDKDQTEGKVSKISKSSKLDQPIMVGLYIEDKSSHRGPIPLLIKPSMSLKKLKKQIEEEYNFPRHQQCWILKESFAVNEDASLESYGITEAGSPILLYVMAKDSKSQSLPNKASTRQRYQLPQSGSSSDEDLPGSSHQKKIYRKPKLMSHKELLEKKLLQEKGELHQVSTSKSLSKSPHWESKPSNKKGKSVFHKKWEEELEKKTDYKTLVALDDVDLVANVEAFECPVCFLDVEAGDGAVLQDCLHGFCKECLASSVQYSDTAMIKCPFRNDEYSCESHLQEREIKCLVTPEIYEKHLQRSMALAESQALDSFHCKTPDCPGWCLFEDNVNIFRCPVCKRTNCLTCAAIHEGKNCRQYQDAVDFNSDTSEEAKKTKEYLQSMVQNGEAMECPHCQVILMKKWGCDWLKCSMCHTEVCWVTKGPRWGPGGKGDTSGGCKCMLKGVRCHPKCSYCH